MTQPSDLIAYLFEGQLHMLSAELFQRMKDSPRFTHFVETYRDKIRKKLRITREPESILDLRSELDVARGLLGDRRLDIQYEPYASAKRRGPDFAVTYRTNQIFNIEVARMRTPTENRFLRLLLYKLGQMQPGMPNLLVIHTETELVRSLNLDSLMQDIKLRVEKKDPAFYELSRYASPAAFYKDFLHMSAILLWAAELQIWVNKQARPPLATEILRVVSSLPPGTLDD
ncbi:MAG TPA: hypothetical protein VFY26_01005 [Anaerolineales bacterium]|nr:hypothetical protein [Anaerolineales bacterium]